MSSMVLTQCVFCPVPSSLSVLTQCDFCPVRSSSVLTQHEFCPVLVLSCSSVEWIHVLVTIDEQFCAAVQAISPVQEIGISDVG